MVRILYTALIVVVLVFATYALLHIGIGLTREHIMRNFEPRILHEKILE